MKSAILKGRKSNNKPNNRFNKNKFNNPSHRTIKPISFKPKPFTKSNHHQFLNKLIVENNESEDDAAVAEDMIDNNDSALLVNSRTTNKDNPRDTSELLPIPSKVNSTESSTKKIVNKSEIDVNGEIYREVGKNAIYCLSKASSSSVDSLVDRGANGGVIGNAFRVIAKHPDRTVDTRVMTMR